MSKLERLLNLTAVLLHTGRPLTVGELRDRVPGYPDGDAAFRRAFERDKEEIRELGIPLELIPIPGTDPPAEGYRIPRNRYYLADPGLEPDELVALQLAASAVRLDDTDGKAVLWTLGGVEAESGVFPMSASLPADPNLSPLFDAVSKRAEVRFDYRDERRTIRPYRLGFQLGHWYLRGFDLTRDDTRVFRVDRIDGDVELGRPGAFEIPAAEHGAGSMIPDRWQLGSDPPLLARVRIDASRAPFALAQFDPDHVVEHHPDGAVDVVVTVTNRGAFRSLVLSYLEHAEVLEPPELRAEIVSWLREVADPPTTSDSLR